MKINVLSIPRSGSAYFRSMVAQKLKIYNSIYTISEPFNEKHNHGNLYNILDTMNLSHVVVTKNHIDQLLDIKNTNEEIYQKFINVGWFNIVLLRKNIFENTLSRAIALIKNSWNNHTYSESDSLLLDIKFFKDQLDTTVYYWKSISTNLLKIQYNNVIYYEDLSFEPNTDFDFLNYYCNFPLKSGHIEFNTTKSPEKTKIVSNYNELKEFTFNYMNKLTIYGVNITGINLELQHPIWQ